MRVTFDEEADAAYIYFQEKLHGPVTTSPVEARAPTDT
jgi:uncharacterized protein YuzE